MYNVSCRRKTYNAKSIAAFYKIEQDYFIQFLLYGEITIIDDKCIKKCEVLKDFKC